MDDGAEHCSPVLKRRAFAEREREREISPVSGSEGEAHASVAATAVIEAAAAGAWLVLPSDSQVLILATVRQKGS